MSAQKLVMMANQIAQFFESQPDSPPADQTAEHLKKFWDPRMRAALIAHFAAGGEGMSPTALAAAQVLADAQRKAKIGDLG